MRLIPILPCPPLIRAIIEATGKYPIKALPSRAQKQTLCMNIKTKIVAALTLAVFLVPGISMAQTMSVAQLQAEIASLTAQLTQLEAQLTAAGGSPAAWCYTFNTNLSIGMNGSAVTGLQTALQKDGETITVNGTFDDQTAAAVTSFQEKYQNTILAPYNLTNGTGYAGKSTRAELNSLFGCTGSNPVTPPIVVNSVTPPPTPTPVPTPTPTISQAVVTLTASPSTIAAGQSTTLAWSSTGSGTGCTLTGTHGYNDNGSWSQTSLPSSDSKSITPYPSSASAYTAQYQVACAGPTTTSNSISASVIVNSVTVTSAVAPYIAQVSPTSAAPGVTITITGQNFDSNSYISLGNVPTGPENLPVAVTSETPTSLTFTVPSNFATGPQPLYVAEHNSTLVSNEGTLTISAAPYISQLNPTTAAPGAIVTVTGYDFDSNSYISLGNIPTGPENFPVAVTSETPTILTFMVPSNFATGPQSLYVAEHGSILVSNKGTLTISAAPYISQINPAATAPGAIVTITGQNFDANSYIAIGNAPGKPESQSVTPTSYTATSLTFVVPAYGISIGYSNPLYVAETNSNLVSNAASLTVSAQ